MLSHAGGALAATKSSLQFNICDVFIFFVFFPFSTCCCPGQQGGHLVKRLQKEGYWVRGVDIKRHEYFEKDPGDEFLIADMRDPTVGLPLRVCTPHGQLLSNVFRRSKHFIYIRRDTVFHLCSETKSTASSRVISRSFIDDKCCTPSNGHSLSIKPS